MSTSHSSPNVPKARMVRFFNASVGMRMILALTLLFTMAQANSALGVISSDDFNDATLDAAIWTFVNPLGDGGYTLSGTCTADALINISVPAGTEHQLFTNGIQVPHILQDADDTDFEVEVKFESSVNGAYQEQGILVKQDDDNFMRFEFYGTASNTTVYAATLTGVAPPLTASVKTNTSIGVTGIAPLYMRVNRTGNQWTQSYSTDGTVWTTAVTFAHTLAVTAVGTYAGNAVGGSSPAHTSSVDYFFNTASPITPEDAPCAGTYELTVSTTAGGTITAPPTSPVTVDDGVPETITAAADPGYTFTGWTIVTGTGVTIADPLALSTTATLTVEDAAVQANFILDTYSLTVTSTTPGGTITVPATSPTTVDHGVAEPITAVADPGYTFTGWTIVTGTGVTIADPLALSTTATLTVEDAAVQANFILDTYSLTVTSTTPGGTITVPATSPTTVDHGVAEPITAVADPGYTFTGWTIVTGTGVTIADPLALSTTATLTVEDAEVQANFILDTYSLTVTSTTPGGTITVPATSPTTVDHGVAEPITAVADPGYTFTGWTIVTGTGVTIADPLALSTTATLTVEDAAVQANFILDTYSLTVTSTTPGGTITVPATSPTTVDHGVAEPITAVADPGYTFTGWTIVTGTGVTIADPLALSTTATLTVEDAAVQANFILDTYSLTVTSTTPGGTITVPATSPTTVDHGVAEPITAVADPGYTFTGWTIVTGTGVTIADPLALSTTATLTVEDAAVQANFILDTYSLTVTSTTPGGTITVPATSPTTVDHGVAEPITAVADPGYTFTGWTIVTGTGVTIADPLALSTTATLTVEDAAVQANFILDTYSLTVTSTTPGGTITVPATSPTTVDHGVAEPITAVADPGYTFTGWTIVTGTGVTIADPLALSTTATLTVEDAAVQANFILDTYSLTVTSTTPGGTITVPATSPTTVDHGVAEPITAVADPGYTFTGWTIVTGTGVTIADPLALSTTATLTVEDAAVQANFVLDTYSLTVTSTTPGGTITVPATSPTTVDHGVAEPITAVADPGYTFTGWTVVTGTGVTIADPLALSTTATLTVEDAAVQANFILDTYSLTVTSTTPGGTITVPATSPTTVDHGVAEPITAVADPGYTFTGWTIVTGTGVTIADPLALSTTATLTVEDAAVQANFILDTYSLTVTSTTPGGTITVPATSPTTVDHGVAEPITAVADPGYTFTGWTIVTGTGVTIADPLALSTTATLTVEDAEVQATFVLGVIYSDDFNDATLDAAVWSFIDPLGGGGYTLTGTCTDDAWINISVPSGSEHQLWTNGIEAPHILQDAGDTDFELEVKFESSVSGTIQEQGILVKQDDANFLRFEFYSASSVTNVIAATLTGVAPPLTDDIKFIGSIGSPQGTAPLYMRVNRTGDLWTQSYSTDGTVWTSAGSFTQALAVTAVGTYAGNAVGVTSPAHTSSVDYFFNTASPVTPEDAPCTGTYQLTVSTTAGGTIEAPLTSPVTVSAGVPETITAAADPGYTFTGWTIVTGTGVTIADPLALSTTATLTVEDAEVQANFILDTYSLTVTSTTPGGTITVPATSPTTVDHGVAEPITAVADPGYTFTGWTIVTGTGVTIADPLALSTTATLTVEDAAVQANFILDTYSLTVTSTTPGGTITVPATSPTTVDHGVAEPITAVADPGYTFTGWTIVTGTGVTIADPLALSTTATLTVEDAAVQANFVLDTYSLTVTSTTPGGTITVPATSPTTVDHGVAEPITAVADPGYTFTGWTVVTGTGVTIADPLALSTTATLTVEDAAVQANFILDTYSLTVTSTTPGGTITVPATSPTTVDHGVAEPITAVADPGYTFTGWTIVTGTGVTIADPLALSTTATLTVEDAEVQANFVLAVISSDDFNDATLDAAVWSFIDPLGDGGYTLSGTCTDDAWINISVPSGSEHQLWTSGILAPHIVQDADDSDFELEVKFESSVSGAYQEQGILVKQDSANFVRFEFFSTASNTTVYAATLTAGAGPFPLTAFPEINTIIGTTGIAPLYMRVNRTGDQWTQSYSTDGTVWTTAGTFAHTLAVTEVGTYAGNAVGVTSPAHTSSVDYFFNTASPVTPEDAPCTGTYQLTVSTTAGGTIEAPLTSPVTVSAGVPETITAAADPGYTFTGWTVVTGTGVIIAAPSALSTTATLTVEDAEVQANFVLDTYELTVSTTVGGSITVPGTSPVTVGYGVAETITAFADPGYTFSGWTVVTGTGVTIADPSALSTTATLTVEDAEVRANFVLGVISSDDFNDSTLNASVWSFVDPLGDGGYTLTGTCTDDAWINISVPSGAPHELWTNGIEAPHIVQDAGDSDFELEVKFESSVSGAFQEQGILVKQDSANFMRFEFYSTASNTTVFAATLTAGSPTVFPLTSAIEINTPIGATGIAPLYMRVNRTGDQWTQSYSTDGAVWTAAGTFAYTLAVAEVGTYAGNAGSSPAHTSSVDYFFNTASPVTPEDAPCVGVAPVIVSTAVTAGVVGQLYSYDVDATGSPTPTYNLLTAPAGMTINATSGLIGWTPTAVGSFPVSVEAVNAEGADTQSFSIVVAELPQITSTPVLNGGVGRLYNYDVDATGTPTPTYALVASPAGMTIDPVSGLIAWTPTAAGDFAVSVQAVNVAGNDQQDYSIRVDLLPDIPTLISPPDASLTTDNTPEFVWSSTAGAGGEYTLEYALDAAFSVGVVTVGSLVDTTYTVPASLSDDTYYWHVEAIDAGSLASGYQASPFSFTLNTQPPAVPTLLTPADLSTINDNTPTMTWSATAGPGGNYTLEYGTDSLFGVTFTVAGLTTESYTVVIPLADGPYFWHVKAEDQFGLESGYQAVPFKFTVDASLPTVPLLLTPPHLSFTSETLPTFEWTAAQQPTMTDEDRNGMAADATAAATYNLQYSMDPTFNTATTMVIGLADTTYTVPGGSPLGLGAWYWHVESVDDAGNQSGYQATPSQFGVFLNGDVNGDDAVTSSDIITLVNYVFKGGPDPIPCKAAGDINCDGSVTSADIIALVNYVFKGGPPPCNVGARIADGTWDCP